MLTPAILELIHAMRHLERWSKEYFVAEDRLVALIGGRKQLPDGGWAERLAGVLTLIEDNENPDTGAYEHSHRILAEYRASRSGR